jgi:hypothetical protein
MTAQQLIDALMALTGKHLEVRLRIGGDEDVALDKVVLDVFYPTDDAGREIETPCIILEGK